MCIRIYPNFHSLTLHFKVKKDLPWSFSCSIDSTVIEEGQNDPEQMEHQEHFHSPKTKYNTDHSVLKAKKDSQLLPLTLNLKHFINYFLVLL